MKRTQYIILLTWFIVVSVPISSLMAQHYLQFSKINTSLFNSEPAIKSNVGNYQLVHILSASCGCSKKITKYLIKRNRQEHIKEVVFVVDGSFSNEKELTQLGYTVVHYSPEELFSKFKIDAAPQLVILNDSLEIKYAGGYKEFDEVDYNDLRILSEAKNGKITKNYPVFGCAFTKDLKKTVDPFGLKYTSK